MEEYQSIKKVYAEPMDRLIAEAKGLIRDVKDETEDGYIVVYENDYTSWSPKDTFEKGYRKIDKSCKAKEESMNKEDLQFLQLRESIDKIIGECRDDLEKLKDENYSLGFFFNLGKKVESGDIEASLKISILAKILGEK